VEQKLWNCLYSDDKSLKKNLRRAYVSGIGVLANSLGTFVKEVVVDISLSLKSYKNALEGVIISGCQYVSSSPTCTWSWVIFSPSRDFVHFFCLVANHLTFANCSFYSTLFKSFPALFDYVLLFRFSLCTVWSNCLQGREGQAEERDWTEAVRFAFFVINECVELTVTHSVMHIKYHILVLLLNMLFIVVCRFAESAMYGWEFLAMAIIWMIAADRRRVYVKIPGSDQFTMVTALNNNITNDTMLYY